MALRWPGSVKLLGWISLGVAALITAHVGLTGFRHGEFCWECVVPEPPPPHRGWTASLKTLASAQADFRGNDRDGNGKQDFWRGDVAGLYTLTGQDGAPIQLTERSVAGADAAPVTDVSAHTVRGPKAGFWYKALRHADEDPAKLDPNRFAFCAYPARRHDGKSVFVISEENTIYKRKRPWSGPGDVPPVYPDPETLKREWTKLD